MGMLFVRCRWAGAAGLGCARARVLTREGARPAVPCPARSGQPRPSPSSSYPCLPACLPPRCRDGISHSPLEFVSPDDVAASTATLYQYLRKELLAKLPAAEAPAAEVPSPMNTEL